MNLNEEHIVVSIKKMLGLEDSYTPFDTDIIIHINSALMKLTQLGVGPEKGFIVTDYDQKWGDFLTNPVLLGSVKTYVYLQVKMLFDPPGNSFVMDAMKQQAEELGWRLNVQAESVEDFDFMHNKTKPAKEADINQNADHTVSVTVDQVSSVPPVSRSVTASATPPARIFQETPVTSSIGRTESSETTVPEEPVESAGSQAYTVEGESLNLGALGLRGLFG